MKMRIPLTLLLFVFGLNSFVFGQLQTVDQIIHFDFDSDKLSLEGVDALENLIKKIPKDEKYEIRISGHTDQIGSDS